MNRSLVSLGTLAFAFTLLTPACGAEVTPSEEVTVEPPVTSRDGGSPSSADGKEAGPTDGPVSCPYDGPPLDVSGFAKCGDGGRCVPAAVIPPAEQSRLAKCDGGFCVPEKIIAAQGNHLPKTCKSIADGEGRCTSIVFPDLLAQKDSLPIDVCDANERCAPCFDPLTGEDSGACRSVSCDAPKTKAKVFGECCKQGGKAAGRCVPKTMIPQKDASGLEKKECEDAELCAPADMMDPKYVPPKCKASAILGNYDGVCISDCVAKDFFTQLGTAKGNCAAGSFCAPCKNPLTGGPTGAPGCAP
ncbi:MAG: hypothetical protein KF819_12300 [Labilithrix sp.]|nr:hypothetical protein [Labilithrix sp.]